VVEKLGLYKIDGETMSNKELGDVLQGCGAVKFGDFTLASGKKSRYYVDVKKAVTKPEILKLICRHIADVIIDHDIRADYIACVELGAVPIGVMMSVWTGLPLLIIRKAQKDYGLKSRIIGDPEKAKTVLLVEDVTTTGGSVISAVKALRDEGLIVRKVISVVDRDEGAEDELGKEGLDLISLISAKTLLEDYEIADVLRHSGGVMTNDEMFAKK
jgi:orotate phosphoribosyltransferase